MRMDIHIYLSMYSHICAHQYQYTIFVRVYIFYNKYFLHFLREIDYYRYWLDKRDSQARQLMKNMRIRKKLSCTHTHTQESTHTHIRSDRERTHIHTLSIL